MLERAYSLARDRQDHRNVVLVASSLVSLHIETLRDADQAQKWLQVLQEGLKHAGGESDIREYEELARTVEKLSQGL